MKDSLLFSQLAADAVKVHPGILLQRRYNEMSADDQQSMLDKLIGIPDDTFTGGVTENGDILLTVNSDSYGGTKDVIRFSSLTHAVMFIIHYRHAKLDLLCGEYDSAVVAAAEAAEDFLAKLETD